MIGRVALGWAALILLAGLTSLLMLFKINHLIISGWWHDSSSDSASNNGFGSCWKSRHETTFGIVGLIVFMASLSAAVSTAALAATSEAYGKGGWIRDFQPEIDRANASGELFRIKGHCQSLCRCSSGFATSASNAARGCCFMPVTTASATFTPAPRSV